MSVSIFPLVLSEVQTGGASVEVAYGPMLGGLIQNPADAIDQKIGVAEAIYVDLVGLPGLSQIGTTREVQPGELFTIPAGFVGTVRVNAATSGHAFAGIIMQSESVVVPFTGDWPPDGPTTLTEVIKSYLYQQYNDDDDLQVFVNSFNDMGQDYVDWFVTVMLPVYTNPMVSGVLLDWVAEGLYGIKRPVLPSGLTVDHGPFNTYEFNTHAFNVFERHGPSQFYFTDDDAFRRVITWHLWKGDGKIFNIRWLKRRVERFLTGANGGPGNTDQTYDVSVTFGVGNQVNINLQTIRRFATGGAIFGAGQFNSFQFNELDTFSVELNSNPMIPVFKAAVDAGVLELPFQFTYVVNIN